MTHPQTLRSPSSSALKSASTTVVMPAFNTARYIGKAIESILGQTYSAFVLHIHDDGSTDGTTDIAQSYKDARIAITKGPNRGVSSARNLIVRMAETEYVAMMDSDDISTATRFADQLKQVNSHPGVDIVTSSMRALGSPGQPDLWLRPSRSHDALATALLADSDIAFGTAFGRTAAFRSFPFNPQLDFAEDYDFWTRAFLGGIRVQSFEEPLYYYRRHGANSHLRVLNTATAVRAVKRRYHAETLSGPGAKAFSSWLTWASELRYDDLGDPVIVDASLEMAVGSGLDHVWSHSLPKPMIGALARQIMSKLYVRQPVASSLRQIPLVAREFGPRAAAVGTRRALSAWPPAIGSLRKPTFDWDSLL